MSHCGATGHKLKTSFALHTAQDRVRNEFTSNKKRRDLILLQSHHSSLQSPPQLRWDTLFCSPLTKSRSMSCAITIFSTLWSTINCFLQHWTQMKITQWQNSPNITILSVLSYRIIHPVNSHTGQAPYSNTQVMLVFWKIKEVRQNHWYAIITQMKEEVFP
jgi:hypothetical protein